ncbi:MAG: RNA polymerase sigma factor, partial [Gemmataceae bacterium]|nr:RNA polymerase sigma factor [Gemmataceae bacterium]
MTREPEPTLPDADGPIAGEPDTPPPPHGPDAPLPQQEAEWVRAAQAGDRSAFARLVEAYWDRLYRWLYHLTRDRHAAEDLTQETFLRALAAVNTFRPGSNFRAWVFRIGHNNFVNQRRAERRTKHQLPEDDVSANVETAESGAANREALEVVNKAVAELPTNFREALLLNVYEGMSFREVAKVLRTTEETARWRVFKARQKLMKVLPPELLPPGAVSEG